MSKQKYNNLKSYIQTKYDYHAAMGQFSLGEKESLESSISWKNYSDLMEFIDNMELYEEIDNQKIKLIK